MNQSITFIVKGRVQGVGYRAFVRKHAVSLHISGHAKNLANGDVEVIACGAEASLQTLMEKCRKGPVFAKVTELTLVNDVMTAAYQSFEIL